MPDTVTPTQMLEDLAAAVPVLTAWEAQFLDRLRRRLERQLTLSQAEMERVRQLWEAWARF
jgi:hypothetical protein